MKLFGMKCTFSSAIIILLALFCLPLPNSRAIGETDGVDIVLVMDCSGSMKKNDPDKLALRGAAMVAEMIQADGWRYGAVMFEGHVTGTIPLREVEDGDAVDAIEAELQSVYHQNGRRTDLPRGLYQALQIYLESGNIGNTRIIIALTDGEDDPESGRSMKDVDSDRSMVVALAREMSVPIYVIGLNVNGSVSQDINELISSETGADAYDIATADQIEPTLTEILERFRIKPALPEPEPTPTPTPTPKPIPSPTPVPTTIPTPQPPPPPKPTFNILNLFIVVVLFGVVIFVFVLLGNYVKSGRSMRSLLKRLNVFSRLISSLRARKPWLDSIMSEIPIEIKRLPYGYKFPQAVELRIEHVRKKLNLQQVFDFNMRIANDYPDAFRDMKWFLIGTEFYAKQKFNLGITVPYNPLFTIIIDAQSQNKPYKGILSKNRELRITMYQGEDNVYEIVLGKSDIGFGDSSWSGDSDFYYSGNNSSNDAVSYDDYD